MGLAGILTRAPPSLLPMILALAGLARSDGHVGVVACLLAGFHCILRTGEMLNLTNLSLGINAQGKGLLNLGCEQISQQRGAQDMVTVDDPGVGLMLLRAASLVERGEPLVNMGAAMFRKVFKALCARCGLGSFGFLPYSLRRGGATYHFRHCGDINATLFRGRWSSIRAGRIYVTDGAAAMADLKLSDNDVATLDGLAQPLLALSY